MGIVTKSTGELHPLRSRPDWYMLPDSLRNHVRGVPGVQLEKCKLLVHRTHLPLIPNVQIPSKNTSLVVNVARSKFDALTIQNGWKLRHYQHVGRDFIRTRKGTLLADSMRVGKTAQIVAAHNLNEGSLVIVAPLATRHVWLTWLAKRFPEVKPAICIGQTLDVTLLKSSPIVFMHYDLLPYWQTIGHIDIGLLVFDELHVLTNRKSSRAQAAALLVSQAERVVGATGTPLWNKPAGIFSLLSLINPGAWGNWTAFTYRYANGKPGAYGWVCNGTSNEDEFKERLREVMLRRTWAEIQDDLPDTNRSVELIDINLNQQLRVSKLAEQIRGDLHKSRSTIGEIARLRQILGKLKWQTAVKLAARVLDEQLSVVVWCWHREIADLIFAEIAKLYGEKHAFLITGDGSIAYREDTLHDWKNTSASALVITLATGQAGIDLSHAAHAIFCEQDWTPAVIAQAEARTFTATRPSQITYVVANHPIDCKIVKTLIKKCSDAQKLGTPAAETQIDLIAESFEIADDSTQECQTPLLSWLSDEDGADKL